MVRKRVGELLIQHGMITRAQLEAGLVLQVRSRQRIGLTLLEQGAISEKQLIQVLAESLGIQSVDLRQLQVDWSAVHLLRARFCEAHELFPFAIEGRASAQRSISVAMSDPLNQPAVDEIEFTTGMRVNVFVATQSQVREAIFRYYHRAAIPGGQATLAHLTGEGGAAAPAAAAVTAAPRGAPGAPTPAPAAAGPGAEAAAPAALAALHPSVAPATANTAETQSLGDPSATTPGDLEGAWGFERLFSPLSEGEDGTERLERRFWALLRVLQRKGLVSREEFLSEADKASADD